MQVQVKGTTVHYELAGTGQETLVLLPALGTDARIWAPQVEYFASRFSVVVPDVAGHGPLAPESSKLSLDDIAATVDAVLEAVGALSIHVVGLSLGGMVAQHYALSYPESLRSLTLVSTTPEYGDEGKALLQ